jgi:hypothetical protein
MKIIQSRVTIFPNGDRDEDIGNDLIDINSINNNNDNSNINTHLEENGKTRLNNPASLASIINNTDSDDIPSAAGLVSLAQSGNEHLLNENNGLLNYDNSSFSREGSILPSLYNSHNNVVNNLIYIYIYMYIIVKCFIS